MNAKRGTYLEACAVPLVSALEIKSQGVQAAFNRYNTDLLKVGWTRSQLMEATEYRVRYRIARLHTLEAEEKRLQHASAPAT